MHRVVDDSRHGLMHRGQWWVGEPHQLGVVESDDGHVVGDTQAPLACGTDHAEGHHVARRHDARDAVVEQSLGTREPAVEREDRLDDALVEITVDPRGAGRVTEPCEFADHRGVAVRSDDQADALASYAFSRLRFRGRRVGLLSLLLIQMFPNLLAVVALFLFMTRIKGLFPAIGLGSSWGLIFIYLGGALGVNTYLIKGFFDTIPYTLDEAAKIDGCTHFQVFYKIILPLAAPVLAVIGLLSFITTQAEYLVASVILGEDNKTLAVGLSGYVNTGFDNRWGPFAAGSLIGAIPVVLLFLFLQRYIVSGLTSGSVKE